MIYYGQDKKILSWASLLLFNEPDAFDEKSKVISVFKDNKIIAAVIYTNYQPEISIEMSIASVDKKWGTRYNLRAFFKYPFIDLSVKRVTTLCSANEKGIIMFNKRLGFKLEGYHRQAFFDGSDAVSFGMLKAECRWIK